MTLSQIKKLALLSYKNNSLNPQKVDRISKLLKRGELRQYLKCLKLIENGKNITVVLPQETDPKTEKLFKKFYKGKAVNFIYDPSLILGVKILDNDFIYEYNLKDTIDKMSDFITQ